MNIKDILLAHDYLYYIYNDADTDTQYTFNIPVASETELSTTDLKLCEFTPLLSGNIYFSLSIKFKSNVRQSFVVSIYKNQGVSPIYTYDIPQPGTSELWYYTSFTSFMTAFDTYIIKIKTKTIPSQTIKFDSGSISVNYTIKQKQAHIIS